MNKKLVLFFSNAFFCFTLNAQVATVDFGNLKQVIDGFGASTAWHGQLTTAEANAAFKNDNSNQMGLSILRVRIDPNSSQWAGEKANAQKAKAAGAMILASPWSPPASLKTNNNTTGGELKTESYAAYATHLKNFCTYLGNVDVVSIQNEPNIKVDYESCDWTPAQLLDFCKNYAQNIGTPVMMPEAYNFDVKYSDPVLSDSTANSHITYIGGHIYGSKAVSYPNAINKGKKIWMTEHFYDGDTIEECLKMAKEMAECMYFNMNAYIWWYLRQPGCNLMSAGGSLKKKGYTMAQFSKFVRPGYYRVEATYQPKTGVLVVAFKGNKQNAVVVLNTNTTAKSQTFSFKNDTTASLRKYVTSRNKNLNDEGLITLENSSFSDNLEAQSVTTYVTEPKITAGSNFKKAELQIYPNPANDYLHFSRVENVNNIAVYNLLGQQVISENKLSGTTLDISNLKPGIYLVKISQTDGEKFLRFIKEKEN